MKYQTEILAPITLSKNIEAIEFKKEIEVSLDCFDCKRSRRTVVLFENADESYCTPTKHPFNGSIVSIEVSSRQRASLFSQKTIVTARYLIEYDFQDFTDKIYPDREISPKPTWGRTSFTLRCKCGKPCDRGTQNNMVKPWKAACECGAVLFKEVEETPIFKNTERV